MSDADTCDRPKWLLELENRKRKPRLAHEAGAGAPCVICEKACPGLDLHFWRKICKNCKCSKDDHDVDDEDFPQFHLLLGSPRKYKKKAIFLDINNDKGHAEEAFEWIPPDTTKELAIDYMKALPAEKLPIKGSPGAALRRQLLQKQLPLHDIDYKICDELSEQEKKQFEKYLENIKRYVGQGTVTKILSARPYDGSLVTPINATDMQRFSPQNKPNPQTNIVHLRTPSSFAPKSPYKNNLPEKTNLQQPPISSELSGSSTIKSTPIVEKYNIIGNNGDIARSRFVANGIYNKGVESNISSGDQQIINEEPVSRSTNPPTDVPITNPNFATMPSENIPECYTEAYRDLLKNPSTSALMSENARTAEAILADVLSPPCTASDIIGSTLDEKALKFIREKLTNKYSNQENIYSQHNAPSVAKMLDTSNVSYRGNKGTNKTAVPTTIKGQTVTSVPLQELHEVERKVHTSDPSKAEMEVIKTNSNIIQSYPRDPVQAMNANRLKEHATMPPPGNMECPLPSSQEHLQNHQAKVNAFAVPSTVIHSEKLHNQVFPHEITTGGRQLEDHSLNTEYLKGAMEKLAIDNPKSQKCHKCEEEIRVGDVAIITEKSKNAAWHPGCFVCNMCNELLVDLVYFYYKNKLYCGRDLSTLLGIPRCFACDELIFVREYTVAEGHNYHVKHFCCWDCDIPLAGKQYITENDRPLCLLCYQKTYAKTCNMCEKVIAADQQGVAVKDLNFHASGDCFCCFICHKNLLNGRFAVKEKKIFCSKECISKFLHP